MTEDLHPVLAEIKARKRKVHLFDVRDLVGLGDRPVPKIAIRVATKREQDDACDEAQGYAKRRSKNAPDDPDVVLDAKAAAIVAACVRDADRPDVLPVFPTPEIVCEFCTPDQIGALLNLVNQVRRLESPDPQELTLAQVCSLANLCEDAKDTELPERVLAHISRVKLEQSYVLLAGLWKAALAEVEAAGSRAETAERALKLAQDVLAASCAASADPATPGPAP